MPLQLAGVTQGIDGVTHHLREIHWPAIEHDLAHHHARRIEQIVGQFAEMPHLAANDRLRVLLDVLALALFRLIEDLRGRLTVAEGGNDFPFTAKRCFVVFDVPGKDVRGEHAHRTCHQFLVCTRGSVSVVVDDGHASEEVRLDAPNLGLHIPPMIWAVQYRYSPDATLMVLASEPYDATDYIRDYDEFLSLRGAAGS